MLPRWLRAGSDRGDQFSAGVVEHAAAPVYVRRKSGQIIYANSAMCRFSGYANSELIGMQVGELYAIPPTEFQGLLDTSDDTFTVRGTQKLKHKSGELLDVEISLHLVGEDRISAVVHDLREPTELGARLHSNVQLFSIMENEISDVLFRLSVEPDDQYRFQYVNPAFCKATGLDARRVIGKHVHEIIPEPSLSTVLEHYRQAIVEHRTVHWDETSAYPAGTKHGAVSVTPVFNSRGECTELVGLVKDVTERKNHELRLERQKNLYAMLSQTNQAIVKVHDRDGLFADVCRAAVEHGHLRFAAISLLDRNTQHLHVAVKYGRDANYLQFAQISANPSEVRGRGPAGEAVRTGAYAICNDFLNDPHTRPWQDFARQAGIRASAAFPIRASGEVIGVLSLYADTPEFFAEDMLPTLSEMAGDISFALDNYLHDAERARLAHEKEQIIARIADGFLAVDHKWIITYVNAAACKFLGGEPSALTGKNLWTVVPQDIADKLRQAFEMAMAMQQAASLAEYFKFRKSWYRVNVYPSQGGLTVYLQDITAGKLAEEQDRAHREEMHKVSQRLLEVQESERRSLARELHDEVGQCVNAVNMKLRQVGALTTDAEQKQLIDEASAMTGELDEQIGQLSLNLHPSVLDDLGLQPAFQWCIRTRFGNDSKKIRLDVEPGLPRFDANVENVVFRVFQESLSNAFRHGGATQVKIALAREDEELVLSVSDNGQGFDLAAAMQAARAGKSLGLIGMQERARHAGGEISIQSEPGHGTRVELSLPAAPR